MKELIINFSNQLREAVEISRNASLSPSDKVFSSVVITGLGGSGIGGTIVSQLIGDECAIPLLVNKDYFLPSFVNEKTLVIACSYSGNTEETLHALRQALKKKAEIACITSGGEMLKISKQNKINHIIIPGGMPPRACLGYSLAEILRILFHYGILKNSYEDNILSAAKLLDESENEIVASAEIIALKLHCTIPVIYSSPTYEGVAVRFRQQINENAKMLCWHHVFPEMNHNELVGWRNKNAQLAVVILRDKNDFSRTQVRMDVCKKIFSNYTSTILELWAKGSSKTEKTFYFIHLGDWISYFLSELNGADVTEVKVIDFLKAELGKIK